MACARRVRLLLVVLVTCVLTVAGCSDADRSAPTDDGAGDLVMVQLPLRDASRTTDATPDQPGSGTPGRNLPTTVWMPSSGGPYPLVVFSHGSQGAPEQYASLLEDWARSGLVVAAPEFPLTSAGSAGVLADIEQQPADVSFVLDQVLAASASGDGPLSGRIDADEVAVAGHSAGAITVLGLFRECCADPRIDAAVVLAGSLEFFGDDLTADTVPTLFEHGDADETIPIAQGEAAFAAAPGPKAGVVLSGGDHVAPYQDPASPAFRAVSATTTEFLHWALEEDAAALERFREDADSGVASLADDQLGG